MRWNFPACRRANPPPIQRRRPLSTGLLPLSIYCLLLVLILLSVHARSQEARPRARDVGIIIGARPTGALNAITDVAGVRVGHSTLVEGDSVRTGVTVVLPHEGNLLRAKVPAAVCVGNAYGKLIGSTQVEELGNIESPIALTNTLNVGKVADALVEYMLEQPGNQQVRSINVVVGETNDGSLNDIRGRHVDKEHVFAALAQAAGGPVEEGSVGAGTGTVCLGWKGGIGTSSRRVDGYTVGVLVQANFGGALTIAGTPVYRELSPEQEEDSGDGSCMIVVATDAPLDSRNLKRLAWRALAGMARTGSHFSDGSGDYVIAFSTAPQLRIREDGSAQTGGPVLKNAAASLLFQAVIEATEEAIVNALFKAAPVSSRFGAVRGLPVEEVVKIVERFN